MSLRDSEEKTRLFLEKKLRRSESHRAHLEDVKEQNAALLRAINQEIEALYADLEREKRKSDQLLVNILPEEVAEELKRTGRVEPMFFASVTVLFTDFAEFTRLSATMTPRALLEELDFYFSEFDHIVARRGLEKLKTIGDSYMCAGGIPVPTDTHAVDVVEAAWEMKAFTDAVIAEKRARSRPGWEIRIGVHTGPLVAGVIGDQKFAFDIWGETVNLASRMQTAGMPGRINISQQTYDRVRDRFGCEYRGRLPVKNAGLRDMYFLNGPRADSP